MDTPYQPIDCGFYDRLEIAAMRRKVVKLLITTETAPQLIESRIVDLQARQGEEFMYLENGQVIRLDRLISMDGLEVPREGTCEVVTGD
jgi:Rho-binding antiterminator